MESSSSSASDETNFRQPPENTSAQEIDSQEDAPNNDDQTPQIPQTQESENKENTIVGLNPAIIPYNDRKQTLSKKSSVVVEKNLTFRHEQSCQQTVSNLIKKQCRICLEDQREGRMLSPCQCSGSITYAHEKCLKEWIKRKHDSKFPKLRVPCQLCQTPLTYKVARSRSLSMQTFCSNCEKQKGNFVLFFIFAVALFAGIIFLSSIVSLSKGNSALSARIRATVVKNENIRIIYICICFILAILFMFMVILFVIEYGFKGQIVVIDLKNYMDPSQLKKLKNHKKIYPKRSKSRRREENQDQSSQF